MRPWCGPMRPSKRSNCSFSALVAWGPHQGRIHFWIPDKSLTTRNIHIRTFGKKVEKIENENPENYRSCVCPEFSNSKFRVWEFRTNAGAIIFRIFIFDFFNFFPKSSNVDISRGQTFVRNPKMDAALMRPSRYQSRKGAVWSFGGPHRAASGPHPLPWQIRLFWSEILKF